MGINQNRLKIFLATGLTLLASSVAIGAILAYIVPRIVMDSPRLESVYPATVVANSSFNSDRIIQITGENLNNIIGIYVNDAWNLECEIVDEAEDSVSIRLPDSYLLEKNDLDFQIQTRITSDIISTSNKVSFQVLAEDEVDIPQITGVDVEKLSFDGNLFQKIEISGDNINEESRTFVEGIAVDAVYQDGILIAEIPFYTWCAKECANLEIAQYVGGYETSILSAPYLLATEPFVSEDELDVSSINEWVAVRFLEALQSEDYLILMAAKDEASVAVTDNIYQAMRELGLETDLRDHVRQSYIAVVEDGNPLYEQISEDRLIYETELDGHVIHIESAEYIAGNYAVIGIDGIDYSVNGRGMNIVVVDKETFEVIDAVCCDFYEGLDMTR
jgi:hypothetical protein